MTVGEALAEARYRAGLTVAELSERTRIREAVITCIEHDDYEACGGDLYVRGYVRAIAGAIGIDAQPLIRAYDEGHTVPRSPAQLAQPQNGQPPNGQAQQGQPQQGQAQNGHAQNGHADSGHADNAPAANGQAHAQATPQAHPQAGDPAAAELAVTRVDLPLTTAGGTAGATVTAATQPAHHNQPAAQASQPAQPAQAERPAQGDAAAPPDSPGQPSRFRAWWARPRNKRLIAAALVLTLVGIVAHDVLAGLDAAPASTAASKQDPPPLGTPSSTSATGGTRAGTSGHGSKAGGVTPKSTTPASAPTPPAVKSHSLAIARAVAFGPEGSSDGDNPPLAADAITRDSTQPWQTDWYISPHFATLKSGTGLLLVMNHTDTITSVRLELGSHRGADIQLRAGSTPLLRDMKVVARASDVGGTFRLTLRTPVTTRYLLIWFTLLPPNGTGRYQASVYRVLVDGVRY